MLRVERLQRAPLLFAPNETTPTNAYASSALLTRRVGKAWGAGVGAGPVWQIVEDLGWYREAEKLKPGAALEQQVSEEAAAMEPASAQAPVYDECKRRPRVYADVVPLEGWAVPLRAEDGIAYMPIDGGGGAGSDSSATPVPSVSCDFGPFGEQTRVDLKTLGAQKLCQFLSESRAHVFNAGASVWGLDWCPIHPDDRSHCSYKYYLAAAPLPSPTHSPKIGIKVPRPSRACVQLWSLGPSPGIGESGDDKGEMHCEMVLCIDSGPALELKWCPLPSHDSLSGPPPASPRKLGLLAGVFEDGSLSVYVVPYPPDLAYTQRSSMTNPVYVRLPAPLLRIELEEAAFCTLDWGNSELIAAGLSNGVIAVYNLGRALRSPSEPALPIGYYCVHQSAIRALTWVRVPDRRGNGPTVIASGGYDGLQCLTDIRELGGHVFNRTRDAINSIAYSPYLSAVVTIDHENTIKSYSLSPSTLGRGHALLDPSGPVWSVGASDYHPQLAVGSADGTCCTTNGLRATRRGGYVVSSFLSYIGIANTWMCAFISVLADARANLTAVSRAPCVST
jgi:transcription factor C subunit 6